MPRGFRGGKPDYWRRDGFALIERVKALSMTFAEAAEMAHPNMVTGESISVESVRQAYRRLARRKGSKAYRAGWPTVREIEAYWVKALFPASIVKARSIIQRSDLSVERGDERRAAKHDASLQDAIGKLKSVAHGLGLVAVISFKTRPGTRL